MGRCGWAGAGPMPGQPPPPPPPPLPPYRPDPRRPAMAAILRARSSAAALAASASAARFSAIHCVTWRAACQLRHHRTAVAVGSAAVSETAEWLQAAAAWPGCPAAAEIVAGTSPRASASAAAPTAAAAPASTNTDEPAACARPRPCGFSDSGSGSVWRATAAATQVLRSALFLAQLSRTRPHTTSWLVQPARVRHDDAQAPRSCGCKNRQSSWPTEAGMRSRTAADAPHRSGATKSTSTLRRHSDSTAACFESAASNGQSAT